MRSKKTKQILLIILFALLSIAGFLYVPILSAVGVAVFEIRALLIVLFLPIVIVTTLPFAVYISMIIERNKNGR